MGEGLMFIDTPFFALHGLIGMGIGIGIGIMPLHCTKLGHSMR
jgi:hypothetical protein